MSLGVCSYCFFNFCLYNFTKFWQESRAHTRVLAFMNPMGCESQADWMNFGYIFQTSTMTLFIQTWQPECRLTPWVINFHSHKTSVATNLIPHRKNAYKEGDLGCKNMLDYYSMYAYPSVNLFVQFVSINSQMMPVIFFPLKELLSITKFSYCKRTSRGEKKRIVHITIDNLLLIFHPRLI